MPPEPACSKLDLALVGDHRAELGLDRDLVEAHLEQLGVLQRERVLGLRLVELRERGLHYVASRSSGRVSSAFHDLRRMGRRQGSGGSHRTTIYAPLIGWAAAACSRPGVAGVRGMAARGGATGAPLPVGAGGGGRRRRRHGRFAVPLGDVLHRRAAAAVGGDEQLEVVRAGRRPQRVLHRHAAGLDVVEQRLVEGLHPVVAALGDRPRCSRPVCVGSMIMSRTRPVIRRTSQTATRPLPSAVGTRRWETTPLSVPASIARACWCWCGGKKSMMRLIVSGASTVWSVESTRWPVSAARQRGLDRLLVAHLADQDHVGVLAQHAAQRALERARCPADLALVDDRALVAVQELDRVLDRDDVLGRASG